MLLKADRVYRPERITEISLDDFEDSRTNPFPWFRICGLHSILRSHQ